MARDTLLGFPAHTLPYRRGEFITLSTASDRRSHLSGGLFMLSEIRNLPRRKVLAIFEIIDRLFALPINLFTILRIMPFINSHPLDLFRVSACRLDDNGGFLAYAPSPLLDIFAIFATINLGGLLCVSRMK